MANKSEDKKEEVCGIGYINSDQKHVLISIQNPTLCNCEHTGMVQIAITLANARRLQTELYMFLDYNA